MYLEIESSNERENDNQELLDVRVLLMAVLAKQTMVVVLPPCRLFFVNSIYSLPPLHAFYRILQTKYFIIYVVVRWMDEAPNIQWKQLRE
jgi:hypothetical protein